MTKDNQHVLGFVTLIISVVTLILVGWIVSNSSPAGLPQAGDRDMSGEEEATGTPATPTSAKLTMTYNEAVDLYGTYRFQFTNCNGSPGAMSVAAGSTVLLDNRDNKQHVIAIGSQSYTVGAYGFKIASVAKKGDYQITCDGGGAATLSVN